MSCFVFRRLRDFFLAFWRGQSLASLFCLFSRRLLLPIFFFLLAWSSLTVAREAHAEKCPANQPNWMKGRVVVYEPNVNPPGYRGVGEVFVYAYQRGETKANTRFMAVTDKDGYFCIHDTTPGEWVITSWEPFQFRPFVQEITCTQGNCDAGQIQVDGQIVRISDDYTKMKGWGGPWAQTVKMPAGSVSLVKLTFRSGAKGKNPVRVYRGKSVAATDVVAEGTML